MALPSGIGLLSIDNAKNRHGLELGYAQANLYLAPADRARTPTKAYNVCPMAGRCKAPCLYESGLASVYASVKESRIRKTREYFDDREGFLKKLRHDVERFITVARKNGYKPVLRLNGTSDIAWEDPKLGGGIYQDYPGVWKLDYTKIPQRVHDWLHGTPANGEWNVRNGGRGHFADIKKYSLTFSLGGTRDSAVKGVLDAGGNVAAVWLNTPLPASADAFDVTGGERLSLGREYPVIDGTENDLRFRDPHPVIVGLIARPATKKMDVGGHRMFLKNPASDGTGCGASFARYVAARGAR